MRLGRPRVAAGRPVERHVDVLAVIAHREHRLVVPADVAPRRNGRRPRLAVVGRLREQDVEAVHVERVDVAVRRDDLDDRVELAGALAGTERLALRPGQPVVGADLERDPRRRAVAGTRLRSAVAGDERRRRTKPSGRWRSPAPSRPTSVSNGNSPAQPVAAGAAAGRTWPDLPWRRASSNASLRSSVFSCCSAASSAPPSSAWGPPRPGSVSAGARSGP